MNVHSRGTPLGYAQITSLGTKKAMADSGLNPPIPLGALGALLQAEAQNIRWRDDTTDPAAGVGMILVAGDAPFFYDGDLSKIEFIEAVAGAKLNISFYGK
jgi:hypothetical protein